MVRVLLSRAELGGHTMELAASTLGERVTGLLALILLAAGALAVVPVRGMAEALRLELAAAGVMVTALAAWLLVDPRPLRVSLRGSGVWARGAGLLGRLRVSLAGCTRGWGWFCLLLTVSIIRQVLGSIMVLLLAFSLGISIPAGVFLLLVPAACLIWMVPISVNGVGVREWTFVVFFGPFGVTQPKAVVLSLLTWAGIALGTAPGGLLQAFRRRAQRIARAAGGRPLSSPEGKAPA